ncbi:uncharacterized protein LOC108158637 [Drosophila miranda]|uniref:uncharacterized protein LOC108158637 n=1 Tax=Drosophila miranda TaxID=7229 RepID=UPI0007E7CB68|nr:uncharacterized protein LOC108158637 [Drosophila miranda]
MSQLLAKMLPRSLRSFSGLCLVLLVAQSCNSARKWDYEPMSITTHSSDESKLKIEGKIDRVNRGEFAISATIEFRYLLDDTVMVEATAYRSSSGQESDYKLVPFAIPKQPYEDFLNTHYKDMVIENLGSCSNLPQFEDKFVPPWPQKIYNLDKCVADNDGFPEVLPLGFYKIILTFTGPVEWGMTIIVKVTSKLM